jgi:hypothetical protein
MLGYLVRPYEKPIAIVRESPKFWYDEKGTRYQRTNKPLVPAEDIARKEKEEQDKKERLTRQNILHKKAQHYLAIFCSLELTLNPFVSYTIHPKVLTSDELDRLEDELKKALCP